MSFAQRLGIELPLVQAPMAGVQDVRLAVAVAGAGGLGSLPCAMLDAAGIERGVAAFRGATGRPLNLNFFCHVAAPPDGEREAVWRRALAPFLAEHRVDLDALPAAAGRRPFDAASAALVEALRPSVVSFHFGLPDPALLARVRATGAVLLSTATTVDEARFLESSGVDAVIAQGLEAGGHRGHFRSDDLARQSGTFVLLPQIVRAVRVPVIAAGGIADAAGVRAALALGATAVQVGTAYLLSHEATTSAVHRAAIVAATSSTDIHTALTRLFTGRPARGLVNRLMREVPDGVAPAFPFASAAIGPLRAAAEARGSGDFSPLWCGQNASGCRAASAAEITHGLFG